MASLWPVLILGVAVGLYEYYLYESPRPGGADCAWTDGAFCFDFLLHLA